MAPRIVGAWSWIVGLALGGCASVGEVESVPPGDEPAATSRPLPVVPAADSAVAATSEATAVAKVPACRWTPTDAVRRAPVAAPDEATRCKPVSRKLARELRRSVTQAWMREYPSGKLVIEPGCDRLADELAQIDLEYASGHGGGLELARFAPLPDDDAWSVRWISYRHYVGRSAEANDVWQADAIGTFEAKTGTIPGPVMRAAIDRMRAASTLEIHETPPPPKPGTIVLGSFGMSSGNFAAGLVLVDAAGRGTDQFFAGYPGTGPEQHAEVRVRLAVDPMLTILYDDTIAAELAPIAADDPGLARQFAEFFWASRDRAEPFGKWFVRERFVALASALGDDQLVPELLGHIAQTGDASVERTRVQAINTLVALTGFDRRYVKGVARKPDVVADEIVAACK